MITIEIIDKIINQIISEIDNFEIEAKNLIKFSNSKEDRMYLNYINGNSDKYIKFLSLLVKKLNFKNIVELGNKEGLSTLAIYNSLETDAKLTTIDIIKDLRYCPDFMFKDKRVNFLFGDVCNINILEKVPNKIDFLFCDTIHFYDQIKSEFEIYKYLLNEYAIIAIDDIHLNDKGKFWDEINYPKWDLTELCHQSGWGLFLYKNEFYQNNDNLYKSIRESSLIWEKRYKIIINELNLKKDKMLINRIKKIIKKNKLLYNFYTNTYNKINYYIKNKK